MNNLKPCPKCGRNDVRGMVCGGTEAYGCNTYSFEVECKCGLMYDADLNCDSEEEAMSAGTELWNDRHERTCKLTHVAGEIYECSNCNRVLISAYHFNYCKYCGAKFLKDDN